jgi:hypothetical protein
VKKTFFLVLAVAIMTGPGLAAKIDTGITPEGYDELAKQKGLFKTTLVHPDADFSQYTKLNPRKVMLVVQDPALSIDEPATGSLIGKQKKPSELPPPEDLAEFRKIINQALIDELAANVDLDLVKERGPGTLILRVTVMDIVFGTTKNGGGERVPVMSKGTIVFDLLDAETGAIKARFGEQRKCPKKKGSDAAADDLAPWPNLDCWAELAATDLCTELERVRQAG